MLAKINAEPVTVQCRIIFARMGTINTLLEKYDCHGIISCSHFFIVKTFIKGYKNLAFVECTWFDNNLLDRILKEGNINKLRFSDSQLENVVSSHLKTYKFDPKTEWTPKIYFDNAIGEVKAETIFQLRTAYNSDNLLTVKVSEQKFVRGVFHEVNYLIEF